MHPMPRIIAIILQTLLSKTLLTRLDLSQQPTRQAKYRPRRSNLKTQTSTYLRNTWVRITLHLLLSIYPEVHTKRDQVSWTKEIPIWLETSRMYKLQVAQNSRSTQYFKMHRRTSSTSKEIRYQLGQMAQTKPIKPWWMAVQHLQKISQWWLLKTHLKAMNPSLKRINETIPPETSFKEQMSITTIIHL